MFEKVRAMLAKQLNLPAEKITPESDIADMDTEISEEEAVANKAENTETLSDSGAF